MIIYELELSLGSYVTNNGHINVLPDASKQKIIVQEQERGSNIEYSDINLMVSWLRHATK